MEGGDQSAVAPLSVSNNIAVRRVSYTGEEVSRGVFALRRVARGEVIEIAPCLKFSREEHELHAMQTVLKHYTFAAGGGEYFLALGVGSLFNHADPPNVEYRIKRTAQEIHFVACRDVEAGEELCIFYGRNLWFPVVGGGNVCTATATATSESLSSILPFADD